MTLGLSMISNKYEAAHQTIQKYRQYFDEVYLTVADKDKKAYDRLRKAFINDGDIHVTYFKWCDDFAAARNFNLEQIKTDFWYWMDDDDEIIHPERLKDLVTYMESNSVDVVHLKYDYAQNEAGEAISDHWRERLIRNVPEVKWDAPVHETLQGPPCITEQSEWVSVKHIKDKLDVQASMLRNKRILEKHWQETQDPRDAQYLGMTAVAAGQDELAIKYFMAHIERSGSSQDMYRSWCRIAECEWKMGNFDQALYATDEAIKLHPDFPDAYHIKVIIYTNDEKYDKGIEWLKVAVSKPIPETMNVVDPTLYKYRGLAMGAQCFLFSGKVKEAYRLYQEVIKQAPDFFKNMGELDGVNWETIFEDAYFDQKAIDYTKWLLHYTKGNKGKPEKIFESLPARIFSDIRLNPERANFLPKKVWPKKSIVFYCGQGQVQWGPEFLAKDGVGGSEEAVIYLSRELAKLGWQVTVFNEREEEYTDLISGELIKHRDLDGRPGEDLHRAYYVTYKPWTLFNPWDEFDVFVGWRLPGLTRDIKARLRVMDLHDTPIGHATITNQAVESTDKFMFKSKFQTKYAENVPKGKVAIVGNGIVRSHFDE